ncbi:hypothetical protein [Arthrobacter sp. Br18]|uniref:hypothetical protein n=1 Tax=Arthrobacter sp. Br18 TaxID=1312954 RepID=UPI000479D2D2|nr:hypothetical protein [Arthrobacter sp. Br18]
MSTPDPAVGNGIRGERVAVSGPTASPWLGILARCTLAATVVIALISVPAGVVAGFGGALSALFGFALVVLFFGISLAIGHFASTSNPSGALGLFAVTYAIKVVGFAAVLFFLGTPDWLAGAWFFTGAVVTVVVWQVVEVFVFSRTRHQLYEDEAA